MLSPHLLNMRGHHNSNDHSEGAEEAEKGQISGLCSKEFNYKDFGEKGKSKRAETSLEQQWVQKRTNL